MGELRRESDDAVVQKLGHASPERRTMIKPTISATIKAISKNAPSRNLVIETKARAGRARASYSQHHREGAHVEDALHSPDGDLRGEGQALFLGDDVRTNHFAGAAQQRQCGEAYELWGQQSRGRRFLYRLEKNSPAHGAQHIGKIGKAQVRRRCRAN